MMTVSRTCFSGLALCLLSGSHTASARWFGHKSVGGDQDEHGCYTSAGYEWCASTSQCIRPFAESCPIEGPTLSFSGSETIVCQNAHCNLSDDCEFTQFYDGEFSTSTTGGPSLMDLNGIFKINPTCSDATCQGCSTLVAEPTYLDGWGNCDTANGFRYCSSIDECIDAWNEVCDFEQTEDTATAVFRGPVEFDCNRGVCNALSEDCVILAGGTDLTGRFFPQLTGNYDIADPNCSVVCEHCSAIPSSEGSSSDEDDSLFGTFSGPTPLTCQDGVCRDILPGCGLVTSGNQTFGGPYLSGLQGDYYLPEGCLASCNGCEPYPGTVSPNGIVVGSEEGGSGRKLRGA